MDRHGSATTQPDTSANARLQLRYCPRCGALGVAPADADNCPACRRALAWIYGSRCPGHPASTQRKDPHAPAYR